MSSTVGKRKSAGEDKPASAKKSKLESKGMGVRIKDNGGNLMIIVR